MTNLERNADSFRIANAYDFDGTVYGGDSSVDFFRFCLCRCPGIVRLAPRMALAALRYRLGIIDKTMMKEAFFSFLGICPANDELLDAFWDAHMAKIKPFYLAQKRPDDLIISASPAFLLAPACRRLGVHPPIASIVDARSGRFTGKNCRGEEKVTRLRAEHPGVRIASFYSDSRSDAPLAALAKQAWLVKGNKLVPW